jgi:hypothetical protein
MALEDVKRFGENAYMSPENVEAAIRRISTPGKVEMAMRSDSK